MVDVQLHREQYMGDILNVSHVLLPVQLASNPNALESSAFGCSKQAAIASARPEQAEAFSREAVDGGCSAAQLSSGIGDLQQPTVFAGLQFAKPANRDIDLLVGSVDEADDMHLARHAGLEGQNCLRCVVIHNKRRLACIAPWAKVRPSHLGGSWGLGCLVCAAGLHNPAARTARERLRKCRDSKWATFQFAELPARHAAVVDENWSTRKTREE